MTLIQLPNRQGIILSSVRDWPIGSAAGSAMDAAGESAAAIGRVVLEGGAGTKTISSGGGKIHWSSSGPNTFANAGTNLRIGIQDVASGLEDGSFDVFADLVGGTDAIPNSSLFSTAMESGTKDITHGDLVAIVFEMTARGGSDSVVVARAGGSSPLVMNYPYSTSDVGAGPVRATSVLLAVIEFDDGTIGWIEFAAPFHNLAAPTAISFAANSSPDEYAALFRLPFRCSLAGWATMIGSIGLSTDDFELILYTDPLGTPAAARTKAVDPDESGGAVGVAPYWAAYAPFEIKPNTWYGLAVRPTTNNAISIQHASLLTGNAKLKRATPFGEEIKLAARSDQTGAFVETEDYHLPFVWLMLDKFAGDHGPLATHILGI